MLRIDHVLLAASDLVVTIARLFSDHGLVALPGGLLQGGLRNAIVPLREGQYIEVIAVDRSLPHRPTNEQRWILDATSAGDRLVWFAARSDDLDSVAERTGRRIVHNVASEEGGPMRGGWRSIWPVGGALSGLPFFIEYDMPWAEQHWAREADYARAASPAKPEAITEIEVSGVDPDVLSSWICASRERPPIAVVEDATRRGIRAVHIEAAHGEIILH